MGKKELYEKIMELGEQLVKYDNSATFIFAAHVDAIEGVVLASNATMTDVPDMLAELADQLKAGYYEAEGMAVISKGGGN